MTGIEYRAFWEDVRGLDPRPELLTEFDPMVAIRLVGETIHVALDFGCELSEPYSGPG